MNLRNDDRESRDDPLPDVGDLRPTQASEYLVWISPELINETIRLWERRSPRELSEAQAVELIVGFAQLLDIVFSKLKEDADEAVYRTSQSEQP